MVLNHGYILAVDFQLINEKSGATIAYDYFSKDATLIADEADRARIERVYAYIEDGDLWRKALPSSKEFSTYDDSVPDLELTF